MTSFLFNERPGQGKFQQIPSIHELAKMGMTEPPMPVPEGSEKKGAAVFKSKCAACHTLAENGGTKAGPNLHGLFGRPAGTQKDYVESVGYQYGKSEEEEAKYRNYPLDGRKPWHGGPNPQTRAGRPYHINSFSWEGRWYSDANTNSGIVWSDKHLYSYLEDPRAYLPGTKMMFCGIKSDKDRAHVIEYLRGTVGATAPGYGAPYEGPEVDTSAYPKKLAPFVKKKSTPTHINELCM